MAIRLVSEALDRASCKGNDLLVLVALCEYADDRGRCWPSVEALARRARITPRSARRSLARLRAMGLVRIEQSAGGRARTNVYVCNPSGAETRTDMSGIVGGQTRTGVSGMASEKPGHARPETRTHQARNPDRAASAEPIEPSEPTRGRAREGALSFDQRRDLLGELVDALGRPGRSEGEMAALGAALEAGWPPPDLVTRARSERGRHASALAFLGELVSDGARPPVAAERQWTDTTASEQTRRGR